MSRLKVAPPLGSSTHGLLKAIHVIDGRTVIPPNAESHLVVQNDIGVTNGERFHEPMISPFHHMRNYLCRYV